MTRRAPGRIVGTERKDRLDTFYNLKRKKERKFVTKNGIWRNRVVSQWKHLILDPYFVQTSFENK